MGGALSTVITLDLHLENLGSNSDLDTLVGEPLGILAAACPVLKFLVFHGDFPQLFMRRLGESCPLLTSLSVYAHQAYALCVQEVVILVPALLPQVRSLTLLECMSHAIPDMSSCTNIVSLKMPNCTFTSQADWRSLPPNLQHLSCVEFTLWKLNSDACDSMLQSLQSVHVSSFDVCADALAQLVRAAPVLQRVQLLDELVAQTGDFFVHCDINLTEAANLRVLHERMQLGLTIDATFCICVSMDEPLRSFLTALPCMTCIMRCAFIGVAPADIGLMMSAFPNVQMLCLADSDEMDDTGIISVSLCKHLSVFQLMGRSKVTMIGLLAVCQKLQRLRCLSVHECSQIDRPIFELCALILKWKGSHTDLAWRDDE